MYHDYHNTTHDKIATGGGARSFARGSQCPACVFFQVLAAGFHAASTPGSGCPQNVYEDRLSGPGATARGLPRVARGSRFGKNPSLFHSLQGPPAAAKKGEPVFLLVEATVRAQD